MKWLWALLCFVVSSSLSANEAEYFTYEEFIRKVETGAVQSVTLDEHSSIEGTYKVGDGVRKFECYGATGSVNDPLLHELLKSKKIAITIQEEKDDAGTMGSIFMATGLTMLVFPWVGLGVLIFCLVRLQQIYSMLKNRSDSRPGN